MTQPGKQPALTEAQYLAIVEREERALLGDRNVLMRIIQIDMPRLLAAHRELQRKLAESEAECDEWQKKLTEDAWPEIERLRVQLNQARAAANAQRSVNDALGAGEIERLRAALREMLESFTEPEDDNDILRRARAALGPTKE